MPKALRIIPWVMPRSYVLTCSLVGVYKLLWVTIMFGSVLLTAVNLAKTPKESRRSSSIMKIKSFMVAAGKVP